MSIRRAINAGTFAMKLAPCLLFFFFFLSGCEVIDPKEKRPSFIRIEDPTLMTDPLSEGSDSHDIRYAWVYVDDSLEGVYELPATVYTPKTGEQNIKINAGISKNGIDREKIRYPFYDLYSTDRTLEAGDSTHIEPRFEYYEQEFITLWKEEFDDPNEQNVIARSSSDTSLNITEAPSEIYEGNGSGKIHLNEQSPFFLGASEAEFQFEVGKKVFLELDYKCNDTVNVGILAEYPQKTFKRSLLNLKATYGSDGQLRWNKIYVDLTPIVNEEERALSYEVFLQSSLRGKNESRILIDNFKVLYQD